MIRRNLAGRLCLILRAGRIFAFRQFMILKRPRLFAALFAIAHFTIPAQSAPGATVTLRPVLDTSIHSSGFNPKGTGTILSGNRRSIGIVDRGLLRFDFSEIPTNATITSATLQLRIVQVPIDAVFSPFELHRALKPWAADATWLNATASLPWSSPGAETDYAGPAVLGQHLPASGAYIFASTNQLVADITGWIADPASNHGWLLKSANEGTQGTAIHFGSSESAVPPALEISYSLSVEAPVLRDAKLVSTNFTFEVHGSAGVNYEVQTRPQVESGSWTTITNVAGSGETPALVRVPATSTQQYFRVVQN